MITCKNPKTTEHRFDSPADYVGQVKAKGIRLDLWGEWSGGLREDEVFSKLACGDETHVPAAEAAIKEIMQDLHLETLRSEWINDMAGAYADVPTFLLGNPMSMRRRITVTQEIAPIRLYVSLTSSCGVSTGVLRDRGICLMALVIALSRVRPIELYTFNAVSMYSGTQSLVDICRMPTAPIDMGLICFCFANQSFTRGLCYSYLQHHQSNILSQVPEIDIDKCRALVGASDLDVVFPPIHYNDNYKDPTKWVKDRLATILKLNEEQIEALT